MKEAPLFEGAFLVSETPPSGSHRGRGTGDGGIIESNVHQRAVDFPGEFAVGFHVWLDSGLVVVVRADQVQKSNGLRRRPDPSDNTSE
jgi:hypothetical protein